MNWTPEELQAIVDEHPLVLFMKGEPGAAHPPTPHRVGQPVPSGRMDQAYALTPPLHTGPHKDPGRG